MAILEDRPSGYIHLLYHTSNLCISVVVAQRVRLVKISVICVARLTTSRYIWVESQSLVKFILKTHNIFSGNILDPPTIKKETFARTTLRNITTVKIQGLKTYDYLTSNTIIVVVKPIKRKLYP